MSNITPRVKTQDYRKRDLLKSNTVIIWISNIDMDLGERGLDGLYYTIEGLINITKEKLTKTNRFTQWDATTKHHTGVGDKVNSDRKSKGEGAKDTSKPSSTLVRYKPSSKVSNTWPTVRTCPSL